MKRVWSVIPWPVKLIFIGFAVLLWLDYDPFGRAEGAIEARLRIAFGCPKLEWCGLPAQPLRMRGILRELLKKRYGVDAVTVAGCGVSPHLCDHVGGCNDVTRAWMKNRYGADVFEKLDAEAGETCWLDLPQEEKDEYWSLIPPESRAKYWAQLSPAARERYKDTQAPGMK